MKRITVQVTDETFNRIKLYAELNNVSISKAAEEALTDWMDTIGEGRIDVMTGQESVPMPNNVVSIQTGWVN